MIALNEFRELVGRQLAIPKDLVKQAGADGLACVCGHNRTSAILVAQEMMAAFDTENEETGFCERGNEFRAGDAGRPAHAAMVTRWMPTNSKSCSGVPSTSRHSSMASRMRSVTSSRDRACVWHAGICGNRGYVVAFRVALNHDIELAWH